MRGESPTFASSLRQMLFLLGLAGSSAHAGTIGIEHTLGAGLQVSKLTGVGATVRHHPDTHGVITGSVSIHRGVSSTLGYAHTIRTLWNGGDAGRLVLRGGGDALVWRFRAGPFEDTLVGLRPLVELSYSFVTVPGELSLDFGPTFYAIIDREQFSQVIDFDSVGISGRIYF